MRCELGEQRLGAEAGISHSQSTHGLEQVIGRAGSANARCGRGRGVGADPVTSWDMAHSASHSSSLDDMTHRFQKFGFSLG